MDARLYTGTQLAAADRRAHLQGAAEVHRLRQAARVSTDPEPGIVFIRRRPWWRLVWWRLATFRGVSPAR